MVELEIVNVCDDVNIINGVHFNNSNLICNKYLTDANYYSLYLRHRVRSHDLHGEYTIIVSAQV